MSLHDSSRWHRRYRGTVHRPMVYLGWLMACLCWIGLMSLDGKGLSWYCFTASGGYAFSSQAYSAIQEKRNMHVSRKKSGFLILIFKFLIIVIILTLHTHSRTISQDRNVSNASYTFTTSEVTKNYINRPNILFSIQFIQNNFTIQFHFQVTT